MTPDKDLSARLNIAGSLATPGKWGQYNPRFAVEAKDAPMQEWDTSHHISAMQGDKRKRISEWKHADDAAFAEALVNAYRSGQLITLSDHTAAVQDAVAKAVDDTLDAAHEYTNKTYNMQFLSHPVDRQRIAAAIRSRGVAG